MNRRGFLGKLGLAIVGVALAPALNFISDKNIFSAYSFPNELPKEIWIGDILIDENNIVCYVVTKEGMVRYIYEGDYGKRLGKLVVIACAHTESSLK